MRLFLAVLAATLCVAGGAPLARADEASVGGDKFSITFGIPSPPALRPYSFWPDFSVLSDRQVWNAAANAATATLPWPRRTPPGVLHVEWMAALDSTARNDVLGESRGDSVRLRRCADDPLRDAFRAGHECAHFLLAARHGQSLPLWLDEGMAQLVGYRAAEAYARPLHMTVQRKPLDDWEDEAFSLEKLTSLTDYPTSPKAVAAFYWQASLLVRALHARLGVAAFDAYMAALATQPAGGDWKQPLRDQCYFIDADFAWLATQILPDAPPSPHYSAAWVL